MIDFGAGNEETWLHLSASGELRCLTITTDRSDLLSRLRQAYPFAKVSSSGEIIRHAGQHIRWKLRIHPLLHLSQPCES